ncbi:SET domain protein [Ichthyophthirius multifiliis]|uniref:SET domain protein n=1 Tax=Ichthyophthirius multifiliis TaxID=5932 RepID=G0QS29_ICHMU|nr:SET domain protein [Ichthyophthirius multifiliis]EGR31971.1 SET domain protein [Ichthyophthirius multifiliis]|eukprot:XP_004035457.1 SET domain protein [Ichthyophthirius multifiliis]
MNIYKYLIVPAAFGPLGIPGIAAAEDIPANTIIACIPNKIMISLNQIKECELKDIINENPSLFDEEENAEAEFNIIAMYVIHEKLKGEKSFYKPYFDTIQRSYTMYDWTIEEVKLTESEEIIYSFNEYCRDFKENCSELQECLIKYPQFFQKEDLQVSLINWAYQLIMTRIFGYSLPCTCLVPFGDLFNHSNNSRTHYIVNYKYEKEEDKKSENYKIKKRKLNMEIFKDSEIVLEKKNYFFKSKKLNFVKKHKNVIKNNEIYNLDETNFLEDEILNKLVLEINTFEIQNNPQRDIWDLFFESTSQTEDNDTDEDVKEKREQEYKKLKENEVEQAEQIYQKKNFYKEEYEKENKNIYKENNNRKQKSKEEDEQKKENQENKKQQQINSQIKQINNENNNKINKLKENGEENKQKNQKNNEKNEDSEELSDISDESKWDWYDIQDTNTYFVIATEKPLKKGEQVFLCYGRRTNKFLLQWYGFAFHNNLFDSFGFRVFKFIDINILQIIQLYIYEIIFLKPINEQNWQDGYVENNNNKIKVNQLTKEFRLKRNIICLEFVLYLRVYLISHFHELNQSEILVTIPVSIKYEIFIFNFALKILNNLRNRFSTSQEQDLQILKDPYINYKLRFAVTLRYEHKNFIDEHIEISKQILNILKELQVNQKNIKQAYLKNYENFESFDYILQQRKKIKYYLKQLHESQQRQYLND